MFERTGLYDDAGSEWDESEHPRDGNGKFATKNALGVKVAENEFTSTQGHDIIKNAVENSEIAKQVSYKGLQSETAQTINATITKLKQEYPIIGELEYVGDFETWLELVKSKAIVYFTHEVNTEYKDWPRWARESEIDDRVNAQLKYCLKHKHAATAFYCHASATAPRSIIFNAAIEKLERLQYLEKTGYITHGGGSIQGVVTHEIGHAIADALGLKTDPIIHDYFYLGNHGSAKTGLSEYGASTIGEFIAEAFSEYMNTTEPRPIAKAVGKRIDYLAKERKI